MHAISLSWAAAILLFSNTVISSSLDWDQAYAKAIVIAEKLSVEDKVGIVTGIGWEKTLCVGNTHAAPGFPSLCLQDGPLGIRFADNVTAGVAGINAAASFDKEAMRKRGESMGAEFRAKGIHIQLGPSVDMMRSPYAGRGWEGFGEDPYLAGVAGVETMKGIHSQGVIATAKHFIGNNQETNRTTSSSVIDPRALHEVWLWPYARMIEAGLGAVMCSYNLVNGVYACENAYILNNVLKGELGFRGFVMSDWGATMSGVSSANHGLDMTMPGDIIMGDGLSYFGQNLTVAVREGQVSEERLTDMVMRIIATYYKIGQDQDFPETAVNSFSRADAPVVPVQQDHAEAAREMAAASIVLLANDGILPLSADDLGTLALIGSDAGPSPDGINACPDRGCNKGTLAMGWGSGSVDFPYIITPKDGIQERVGEDVKVVYTFDDWDTEKAARLAKKADVAIVFANADSGEEYITLEGNNDRRNLTLWNNGDNLIRAVADENENTIVVIHSVGPVLMPWIHHTNIRAVVWAGLPGQESGSSLTDVLFGDTNPSGRLPYTIAKKEEDYNTRISQDAVIPYTEKLEVGYKHFDAHGIEPLFPFGHGLSYTSFKYSDLEIDVDDDKELRVTASVMIENTGDREGAEVVQAYITFPAAANEPPKHLRGFEKVSIEQGQKTTVEFVFGKTELSIWNDGTWIVPSGEYSVHIGASSCDIRLSASFEL